MLGHLFVYGCLVIIHNENIDFTSIVIYCTWFMYSGNYGKESVKWVLSLEMDEEILLYILLDYLTIWYEINTPFYHFQH
jgi:hypothetical protein